MKNLIAHFTNITKNVSESRPILQGIQYNKEGGFIAATDSHRLLYYKSEMIPSSYVQHPLTLSFLAASILKYNLSVSNSTEA